MLEDIFVNHNEILIEREELCLSSSNRSFRYGDGLFESIKSSGDNILFLDFHIERLLSSMKALKMKIPEYYTIEFFGGQIEKTITKNNFYTASRIRLSVFRQDGGLYQPGSNDVQFLIEAEEMDQPQFILNQKGYTIDIYSEIKKPLNFISNIKTTSALPLVLASCYKAEHSFEECILLNENDKICEAISSNIFLVEKGSLITPPLTQGCVDGVMRRVIMNLAAESGLTVTERVLEIEDLFAADELFLTNAVTGIRWVLSYKTKRYFNNTSVKLTGLLNQLLD